MDREDEYWQAITVIEAQCLIEQVRAIQSPNLKQNDFKRYADELQKKAFPKGQVKTAGPELTSEELAQRIGSILGKR